MESSETKKKAINLGKQLVKELGREPDVDMLSRWMAHYIAQQLATAEDTTGADKTAAEERCFRTIATLWEHRAVLPHGRRPFEKFEPILRALAALDPEKRQPYYHQLARPAQQPNGEKSKPIEGLIGFIFATDCAARILIQAALDQIVEKAANKQTLAFLENTMPASRGAGDIEVVNSLIKRSKAIRPEGDEEKAAARLVLKSRVEKLDTFCRLCKQVREIFRRQIKEI
jgi:hypothetical protein